MLIIMTCFEKKEIFSKMVINPSCGLTISDEIVIRGPVIKNKGRFLEYSMLGSNWQALDHGRSSIALLIFRRIKDYSLFSPCSSHFTES